MTFPMEARLLTREHTPYSDELTVLSEWWQNTGVLLRKGTGILANA